MGLKDISEIIEKIKEKVNISLAEADAYKIGEMILWVMKHPDYQRVKQYDEQLMQLECFIDVWRQEKGRPHMFETQGDIFWNVDSLQSLGKKYRVAQFALLRIENNVPYEFIEEMIEEVIRYKFSAHAIYKVALKETMECEKNLRKMADIFKMKNELVIAIGLLQIGTEAYPQNEDMLLAMTDLWLCVQQYQKAYESLCRLQNPNKEVQELMEELERLI